MKNIKNNMTVLKVFRLLLDKQNQTHTAVDLSLSIYIHTFCYTQFFMGSILFMNLNTLFLFVKYNCVFENNVDRIIFNFVNTMKPIFSSMYHYFKKYIYFKMFLGPPLNFQNCPIFNKDLMVNPLIKCLYKYLQNDEL